MPHYVRAALAALVLVTLRLSSHAAGVPGVVQFVFTSDAHYGISRRAFRGHAHVDAHSVNHALVEELNTLPAASFPNDGGVRSGEAVGSVDFVAEGGDVANRVELGEDGGVQPAAASWSQFTADYVDGLRLTTSTGSRTPAFVVAGNHDVSNAVGFWKPMQPATDPAALMFIYNRMMSPPVPRTVATFSESRDYVRYTRDIGGLHFVFVQVWPDSQTRAWMAADLAAMSGSTPVIVFAHDQPDVESKHFINPNGHHDVNAVDRFENVLTDVFEDGPTIDVASTREQRALESFVGEHQNLAAYFHGNSNWNEFYDWHGPGGSIALHTFRVDSPMKGKYSGNDETKLSFQVATIDRSTRRMTVRECLWNTRPAEGTQPLVWGASRTVSLDPPERSTR